MEKSFSEDILNNLQVIIISTFKSYSNEIEVIKAGSGDRNPRENRILQLP